MQNAKQNARADGQCQPGLRKPVRREPHAAIKATEEQMRTSTFGIRAQSADAVTSLKSKVQAFKRAAVKKNAPSQRQFLASRPPPRNGRKQAAAVNRSKNVQTNRR